MEEINGKGGPQVGFAFVDESGVLTRDSSQPLFCIGAWFFLDVLDLHRRLAQIRGRSFNTAASNSRVLEFRFTDITYSTVDHAREFLNAGLLSPGHLQIEVWPHTIEDALLSAKGRHDLYLSRVGATIQRGLTHCSFGKVVVVLDYQDAPRSFSRNSDQITLLPEVTNLLPLDSRAALLLQLVDLATGSLRYSQTHQTPVSAEEKPKLRLSRELRRHCGVASLSDETYRPDTGSSVTIVTNKSGGLSASRTSAAKN